MYQHITYQLTENDNYHSRRTAFEIWFCFASFRKLGSKPITRLITKVMLKRPLGKKQSS